MNQYGQLEPGNSCDADDANKVISDIKKYIEKEIMVNIPILYGGSVDDKNAKEFLTKEKIDGSLVGSSSLDPLKFEKIINYDI